MAVLNKIKNRFNMNVQTISELLQEGKTWSGGINLIRSSSCWRDGFLIRFSFVLYLLRINPYLDYFFLQWRIIATWKNKRILYRWPFKLSKMLMPRGSLFTELLFFTINLSVFPLIQELNHVSREYIWKCVTKWCTQSSLISCQSQERQVGTQPP